MSVPIIDIGVISLLLGNKVDISVYKILSSLPVRHINLSACSSYVITDTKVGIFDTNEYCTKCMFLVNTEYKGNYFVGKVMIYNNQFIMYELYDADYYSLESLLLEYSYITDLDVNKMSAHRTLSVANVGNMEDVKHRLNT